ncbi:hypothetical protein PVAG01_00339 [Phlyctema vagabunda]|uniref:Mid2 domain-containing protein n=1 Tax=Phlyctema vagabunda TaxID=108571 RepID=A0ABR4PUB6_9HELO
MISSHLAILTWALAFLGPCIAQSTNSTCFYPDGNVAKSFVACSATGDGGCCLESDFCTGLGYCISNAKGYHYRGACTDSTWFNPSCPNYCLADTNSGNTTSVNVIACDGAENGGTWCCAYDGNCCSSSATYTPYFGTIFAQPGSSTAAVDSSVTTSSSSSATTTSTTSATSASSSQPQAVTTPTSSSAPQAASIPVKQSDDTRTRNVGLGVGIPLGLLALAGAFLFFRERNKRARVERNAEQDMQKNRMITSPHEMSQGTESPRFELPSGRAHG